MVVGRGQRCWLAAALAVVTVARQSAAEKCTSDAGFCTSGDCDCDAGYVVTEIDHPNGFTCYQCERADKLADGVKCSADLDCAGERCGQGFCCNADGYDEGCAKCAADTGACQKCNRGLKLDPATGKCARLCPSNPRFCSVDCVCDDDTHDKAGSFNPSTGGECHQCIPHCTSESGFCTTDPDCTCSESSGRQRVSIAHPDGTECYQCERVDKIADGGVCSSDGDCAGGSCKEGFCCNADGQTASCKACLADTGACDTDVSCKCNGKTADRLGNSNYGGPDCQTRWNGRAFCFADELGCGTSYNPDGYAGGWSYEPCGECEHDLRYCSVDAACSCPSDTHSKIAAETTSGGDCHQCVEYCTSEPGLCSRDNYCDCKSGYSRATVSHPQGFECYQCEAADGLLDGAECAQDSDCRGRRCKGPASEQRCCNADGQTEACTQCGENGECTECKKDHTLDTSNGSCFADEVFQTTAVQKPDDPSTTIPTTLKPTPTTVLIPTGDNKKASTTVRIASTTVTRASGVVETSTQGAGTTAPEAASSSDSISSCPAYNDPESGSFNYSDDSIDGVCAFPYRSEGKDVYTCTLSAEDVVRGRGAEWSWCYFTAEGDEGDGSLWGYCDESCPQQQPAGGKAPARSSNDGGGRSSFVTVIIYLAAICGILLLVGVVVTVVKNKQGQAGVTHSFDNPLYDTAETAGAAANQPAPPSNGSSGAGDGGNDTSGYMDIPAGEEDASDAGIDGGANASGYMDIPPASAAGEDEDDGYMDVAP